MIRAIVVDDELPSADKMAKLLCESGKAEVKGKFTDAMAALAFLKKTQIDAVFLDIEMPEMDGIELSNRMLELQGRLAVVFVTAYSKYAVEAFRLNALDYLLKPVYSERLKETLCRIAEEKDIKISPTGMSVRCFGKFKVMAGQHEVRFRTSKAEELLAFFIDGRGEDIFRNDIIDRVWPEFDGDRAVAHFNTTLYYVKKALIQNGIEVPIRHSRCAYRLDASNISCDYHTFMAFAAVHKSLDNSSISEFEDAVARYTGDYLVGNDFWWAERNRQFLKDKYLELLLKLAGHYKLTGAHNKIAGLLKRGLMHEPLHGELNYRLIEAMLLTNDRISAVRHYNTYERKLKNELGLEADAKFKKLLR